MLGVGQPGEGAQVGQALPPLDPPRPLLADRGGEADGQGRVEVLVRVGQHAAQDPVHLRGAHRGEGQPAHQVHIPGRVEREMDPVHPAAALEQEPVEAGVILVRLTAEERLHVQAVPAGDQPRHGGQLVLAFQPDQVTSRLRALPAQAQFLQGGLDGRRGVFLGRGRRGGIRGIGHGPHPRVTLAGAVAGRVLVPLIAPAYTLISRSTVRDQPNLEACATPPRDSRSARAGEVMSSRSARA